MPVKPWPRFPTRPRPPRRRAGHRRERRPEQRRAWAAPHLRAHIGGHRERQDTKDEGEADHRDGPEAVRAATAGPSTAMCPPPPPCGELDGGRCILGRQRDQHQHVVVEAVRLALNRAASTDMSAVSGPANFPARLASVRRGPLQDRSAADRGPPRHRTECRTRSGAAFGVAAAVPEERFRVTEGEPKSLSRADGGPLVPAGPRHASVHTHRAAPS
jgi:hypothetical protein